MAESSRAFNNVQPRDSFITMRLSYRPGSLPIAVPASAAELLQQRWTCEECSCRYASLGAAFFCTSCGHNSAVATFDHTGRCGIVLRRPGTVFAPAALKDKGIIPVLFAKRSEKALDLLRLQLLDP